MEEKYPALPPEKQDPRIPWKPANAVQRCEESGGHVVEVKTWPPTKTPAPHEPPSMTAQCKRCDAHLVLYEDTQGVKLVNLGLVAKK